MLGVSVIVHTEKQIGIYLMITLGQFFLISPEKRIGGYFLELPQSGNSNKYPQHRHLWVDENSSSKILF